MVGGDPGRAVVVFFRREIGRAGHHFAAAALVMVAGLAIAGFSESRGVKPGIAVYGDSTAIASRIPLHQKPLSLFPSMDRARWWNRLRADYVPNRFVFNAGRKGAGIAAMRERLEADANHRDWTTIIYDRSNGEPPADYLAELRRAVALLETDQFLIMPQVPSASDDPARIREMSQINTAIRTAWPNNTFDATDEAHFLYALVDPSTREADTIHRNPKGWAIEARFISGWLAAKGW